MNTTENKLCVSCSNEKPISSFGKNKSQPDGLHYYCKLCIQNRTVNRKEKNKDYYKKWAEENRDRIKAYQKKYRNENRDDINTYQRNRPIDKKRKHNCSEKKKLREKERRQQETDKKQRKEYLKKKYYIDIQFKLKKQLEARLRSLFIKNDSTIKSVELIGCSIPEYRIYLESKFLPTMSWENYGTDWEMDRIKPFCEFDLKNTVEQRDAMHYANVQPLFKTTRVIEGIEYVGNLNKNKFSR